MEKKSITKGNFNIDHLRDRLGEAVRIIVCSIIRRSGRDKRITPEQLIVQNVIPSVVSTPKERGKDYCHIHNKSQKMEKR